ncbi:hypothetical protein [Microbacterium gallinarum]|jgi:hypothetical protein|uniref:Uncharacterized protein n=1 Tax=Microbacterium gallinarum TaxID=2762209 RepID=A0ABR8X4Z3_9MICO|nr:hypothetical protein [Microbacterium gallinarum]MBD8024268.1 hypothetical protein [Microbacterium gallinarum]
MRVQGGADSRWLTRWIVVVTAGEAVGFLVPAVVGVVASGTPVFFYAMLAAGALEGAVLGAAQSVVLRRRLPRLRVTAWVLLTASGATVAYGAGMLASAATDFAGWPGVLKVGVVGASAGAVLFSLGTAQWLELRRHVRGAGWWVVGTAAAWTLALGAFLAIATPLWHEGQEPALSVLVGIGAGLVMAVVMTIATGAVLEAILRRDATARLTITSG